MVRVWSKRVAVEPFPRACEDSTDESDPGNDAPERGCLTLFEIVCPTIHWRRALLGDEQWFPAFSR